MNIILILFPCSLHFTHSVHLPILYTQDCNLFHSESCLRLNMCDQSQPDAASVITYKLCPTGADPCSPEFCYAFNHPPEMDLAVVILPEGRPATGIPIVKLNQDPGVTADNQELETFVWGSTTNAAEAGDFLNIPRTAKYRYLQDCKDWDRDKKLCVRGRKEAQLEGAIQVCV